MGDYYTLDDMFETSSASKESQAVKDEKLKRRAMIGMYICCLGVYHVLYPPRERRPEH